MKSRCCWLGMVVVLGSPLVFGEERTWEVTGALVGLKPDNAAVVIIELPDRSRIEVPLAALSEAGRGFVRSRGDGLTPPVAPAGSVTVRGPIGRTTVSVPESLKGVETDAIWCRSAADAVKVYRLFLAGDLLDAEDRAAAVARLADWGKRADAKRLRMGEAWLLPEQRAQGRRAAEEQLTHAIGVIRLGNWTLAEDELKKTGRLDPDWGAADVVLGLGYFLLKPKIPGDAGPNLAKAIDFFAEAVRRDPDNANALNNLGLAEMFSGKYPGGVAHLIKAAELALDDQVIVDNLGMVIREAPGLRPKIPEKLLADLNDCYRDVLRNPRLKPLAALATMMLKSPAGRPIPAAKGTQATADLARHVEPPAEWVAESQTGEAAVVADGFVLTTVPLVPEATEILIDDPTAPGRQLAAREVAAAEGGGLYLLRCEGLIAKPLPVAAAGPAAGDEVSIIGRPAEGRGRGTRQPVRGRVVSSSPSAAGSSTAAGFIHRGAVARGSGGSPIVDRRGRLVGLEAPLPRTDASGQAHGLGLPVDLAWPLLREHLPDLEAGPEEGEMPADWSVADTSGEAGTVVVTCRRKASGPQPR